MLQLQLCWDNVVRYVFDFVQLIFALLVAAAVFFLVPRGVSLGGITVETEHRHWNFSEHTYQLNLIAQIPVYNPNYLSVSI